MSTLALMLAEPAVAAAIIEQLRASGLPEGAAASDLARAYIDSEVAAIVIDEALFDKKAAKALPEQRDELTKPVLLLGTSAVESQFSMILPKPFRLGVLIEQLRYQLETLPKLRGTISRFGGYRLEPQSRQLVVEATGAVIRLTEKETALLSCLGQSAAPVSRENLLAAVWGYDPRIDTHTLETHIYQLRRKLDPDGKGAPILINDQGSYRLERSS